MANLQNIRRRIKSVKNIQKITNAMDMIARSRFNSARNNLISYLPYLDKTRQIMRRLMAHMQLFDDSPFIMSRQHLIDLQDVDNRKFLFLVIAADKGLAGSYSSNVIKDAFDTIAFDGLIDNSTSEDNFHLKNFEAIQNIKVARSTTQGQSNQFSSTQRYTSATANRTSAVNFSDSSFIDSVELITVGRKATNHFQRRGYNVIKHFHGISERPSFFYAKVISDFIINRFLTGDIIDVTMIYTKFKSAISCEPDEVTLLPLITDDFADNSFFDSYIYEPDIITILNNFIPRRIATRIYGAMLHSAASELSSRMNAMSNATDNAQELIGKLNLYYNKVRQAGITNEINEIVGGANALE